MKLKENVNFFGLNVSLTNGATHTNLYIKPTDGHQYLNYQPSHPHHIEVSIPYSQTLRLGLLHQKRTLDPIFVK